MTPRAAIMALCLTVHALACGGEAHDIARPDAAPGAADASPPSLRVVVGTGAPGQVNDLADGDTVRLQRGCQGGQHVFVAVRVQDAADGLVATELALARTRDGQVVSLPYRLRLPFDEPADPAYRLVTGLLLLVADPAEIVGEQIILRADLEDERGVRGDDQRRVLVQWGPDAC